MVTCLPTADVAVIPHLDRLIQYWEGMQQLWCMLVTSVMGKYSCKVLEAKFQLLGRKLKARTQM